MKIFISQAMNGLTNEEIEYTRNKAIEILRNYYSKENIEILDSFFKDTPHEAKPLWYLGEAIKLMSTADLVVFINSATVQWADARGCKIEYKLCVEYKMKHAILSTVTGNIIEVPYDHTN